VPGRFDEIEIGQVAPLGDFRVDGRALETFIEAFLATIGWPQTKRLGVDALRWVRNPPAGEVLRGRMTIMGKDPVGDGKGIVIAQHDLLDEAGRLVFSCLTRSVFAR